MPSSRLSVSVCELLTLLSMADQCFDAGDQLLNRSPDLCWLCPDVWHNVAHPLDRPMAISLPFFRLGRALRHNAHSILSELSPDYAPQRSRAVASDHLFCNPWNLIKLISEVTLPFICLPWTNDIFVAVVQATRIQASRLPSGATSKSSSFSTGNQCIR